MSRAPTRLWLAALLALAAVWLPAGAQVVLDSDDLRDIESDIRAYEQLQQERNAELAAIEAALGQIAATLRQRINERDTVSAQLVERRREREQVQARISALDGERVQTEGRIAVLDERLDQLRVRVSEMLLSIYKQRGQRLGSSLSRSESFHDMRVRNHYLSLLADQDADVIGELDNLLAALFDQQRLLADQIAAQREAEASLRVVEAELTATQVRLDGIVAELNSTQQGQMALRQSLLVEQQRIERSLDDLGAHLETELARLRQIEAAARADAVRFAQDRDRQLAAQREADLARLQIDNLTAPLTLSTGFIRPLDEARLISRFGDGGSFIGIQSPVAYAAVRAVRAGRVSSLQYLGANQGYMVAIDHGETLYTAYVNLRQPLVELYALVDQGQVIAYLGGGTLTRPDTLQFYARREGVGSGPFIDPAPLLGW